MAMNKAERARVEELEREAAFRWPTAPEPQPMTLEEIKAAFVEIAPRDQSVRYRQAAALGWVHNAYSQTVEPAWSTGVSHGRGNHTGDGGSQGRGRIYRTRAEAALAMRWEMCRAFAAQLRAVDLLIAESSASSPNPDTSK